MARRVELGPTPARPRRDSPLRQRRPKRATVALRCASFRQHLVVELGLGPLIQNALQLLV